MQLEHRTSAQASSLFNISLSFLSQSSQSTTAQKTWLKTQINIDKLDEQININVQHQRSDMIWSDNNLTSIDALKTSSITADMFLLVIASNTNIVCKLVRIIELNSDLKQSLKQQDKRILILNCKQYVLMNYRVKIMH